LVAGDRDNLVGDPLELGRRIPGSRVIFVPGGDHLSTVSDPRFGQTVLDFLASHGL
jgi:hypothetical protein